MRLYVSIYMADPLGDARRYRIEKKMVVVSQILDLVLYLQSATAVSMCTEKIIRTW